MTKQIDKFWLKIPLKELSDSQWESICDGCAQCCAHKLQCEDTGEIYKTNVVCRYLDQEACQCQVYENRHEFVPDCIKITPDNAGQLDWIPETCGYRLLAEGEDLPAWHPLQSGDKASTRKAGVAVTGKVISEADINMEDIEDYVVGDDYFAPE